MNPQPPTPEYVPTPPQTPNQPPRSDGQTLGIIGLILGILALWPVGLPLSIVSLVKASKTGASKVLGIVGIVFNGLSIIVSLLIIALTVTAYNGIQQRARTSVAQASANAVVRKAEAYATMKPDMTYPATIEDFATYPESKLTDTAYTVTTLPPVDEKSVMYKRCEANAAQVTYYDVRAQQTRIIPLGSASSLRAC